MPSKPNNPFDDPIREDDDGDFGEDEPATDVVEIQLKQAARVARPALLKQIAGAGAPRQLTLVGEPQVIGSSPVADLRVASSAVAPTHAVIERRHAIYFCTAADGAPGVVLNGVQVHSCSLAHGDNLEIGDAIFQFVDGDD